MWSAGPIPLRWGPLTLNLGPCHLVTVQFCNAYDTTTILKVSICNETAAHLQNIAATLFHNSNNALKITSGFTPTVSRLIHSAKHTTELRSGGIGTAFRQEL